MRRSKYISSLLVFLELLFISFSNKTFSSNKEQHVNFQASLHEQNAQQYLVLTYKNTPKWHTYWKFAGDAGKKIDNTFYLVNNLNDKKQQLDLGPGIWPIPIRFIEGGYLWTYGHEKTYSLFYALDEKTFSKLKQEQFQLEIQSKWLVCKNICIPGKKTLTAYFENSTFKTSNKNFTVSSNLINKHAQFLPKVYSKKSDSISFFLSADKKDNQLKLSYIYNLSNSSKQSLKDLAIGLNQTNLITSYPNKLMLFNHEKLYWNQTTKSLHGEVLLEWNGVYLEPEIAYPANKNQDTLLKEPLKLKVLFQDINEKDFKILNINFERVSRYQEMPKSLLSSLTLLDVTKKDTLLSSLLGEKDKQVSSKTKKFDLSNLFYILLLGVLGGIILNVMPCVLPVISLKLFSMMKLKTEGKKSMLVSSLMYTLGVLFTFVAFSLIVIFLKKSGQQVGWGFHLQSPVFIFCFLIVLFLLTLNLFGVFEFKVPASKFFSNLKIKEGYFSEFFNGALITILSTPCSAPFLGTAVAFALSSSDLNIIAIFLSIGLGLSIPFLLIGFFPSLLKFLPKPGIWMEKVKPILGVSLILTSFWLIDVFLTLVLGTNQHHTFYPLSVMLGIFLFFYYNKNSKLPPALNTIILLIITYLVKVSVQSINEDYKINSSKSITKSISKVSNTKENVNKHNWKVFNPTKIQSLKTNNESAFLYFTADWCLTCKVFEKMVLNKSDFIEFTKSQNLKMIKGDWTKNDPEITKFLKQHNLAGVPAYFVIHNAKIISLGETISLSKLKQALIK